MWLIHVPGETVEVKASSRPLHGLKIQAAIKLSFALKKHMMDPNYNKLAGTCILPFGHNKMKEGRFKNSFIW